MRNRLFTGLVALALLSGAAVAAPVYQAAGAGVGGTGAVSPAWPAHAAGDVALLFVESTGSEPVTLSTPAGFVVVTNSPQATGAATGTQLTVFWARATSAGMTAPTVADPGDHVYAQIITYRGVISTGNPWDSTGGGIKAAASTSLTVTGITTTVNDTLVVQAASHSRDNAGAHFSAQTNANLTGIVERADAGTNSGNGGGLAVWDGVKATAGATGNTTATLTNSVVNAFLTIALRAAPPALPAATTNAATAIAAASATLNGTVSSNSATTTVVFDYGTDTSYGSTVTAAESPLASSATSAAVTAPISGLICGTTYHYRVRATNSQGTTNGADSSFTTSACMVCNPPPNIPAGVTVSCQCDNFVRATLNPSPIFGANWTVSTSDGTGILPSIVNPGYLRLTNNTGNNAKAATVPGIFPAAGNYISVEFRQYAYNGSGADGIAVTLSDYSVPAVPGAFGGSLGYAQRTGVVGFAGGWLGVALDEYGNYQNPTEGRLGGPGFIVDSVGARGSGSGMTGYNWLGGTATLAPPIDNNGSVTPSLGYYYQVIVDARNEPTSTAVAVNRDTTGTGNSYAPLISIPNVYTAAAAQGFTQAPVPTNWQISFTGSTGGSTNIHEIGGLRICAQYIDPPTGGTADGFNAIDEAYGTPPLAVQNYLTGHIYTKLVGTSFKLNVAALANSQIVTTYAAASSKTVTVKLVDNSDSLADASKDCTSSCTSTCTGKTAVVGGTQTLTFASGATDKGQKQSPSFTINTAYQKLVAIISDGTTQHWHLRSADLQGGQRQFCVDGDDNGYCRQSERIYRGHEDQQQYLAGGKSGDG